MSSKIPDVSLKKSGRHGQDTMEEIVNLQVENKSTWVQKCFRVQIFFFLDFGMHEHKRYLGGETEV